MPHELAILVVTAASIGLVHTLLGPDHYVPFVVLSRARNWSTLRTALVTGACGIGHVASSVVLGAIGIALGLAVARLQWLESFRGDVAAWLLTLFGLGYMLWGVRRATRGLPHHHVHSHAGGDVHIHHHGHSARTAHSRSDIGGSRHEHPHGAGGATSLTPWLLFVIFVLGPCEPLIPLLMYPAAAESLTGVALVAGVFGTVTVATMLTVVLLLAHGARRLPLYGLDRYGHALAGFAIFACGVAIHLGL
jgi:ABC-type nickel/cobalt efflux system permease component RcnA